MNQDIQDRPHAAPPGARSNFQFIVKEVEDLGSCNVLLQDSGCELMPVENILVRGDLVPESAGLLTQGLILLLQLGDQSLQVIVKLLIRHRFDHFLAVTERYVNNSIEPSLARGGMFTLSWTINSSTRSSICAGSLTDDCTMKRKPVTP